MEPRKAVTSAAIALGLVLTGCGTEDIDPSAVPDAEDVGQAAEEAQAEAEQALADLRAEAQEAIDQMETPEAPEVKQELLDRCREAAEALREADSDTTGTVEDVCADIEGTDVSDMDVWDDIQQEIEDLQTS